MAGGMHATALGSGINPLENDGGPVVGVQSLDKSLTVEVGTLTDERSQKTTLILQERNLRSNPRRAYSRMCVEGMSCQDGSGGQQVPQLSKPRRPGDDRNPALRMAYNFMPILTWLPNLNLKIIKADIIAGLTVGVMVIPQSMSYGAIAGLPYIYGMYSAFVPTLVYAFFGQSRQLAVGPVAMVSLLVEAGLQGVLTKEECPAWYEAQAAGGDQAMLAQYEHPSCEAAYVGLATFTAATVGVMQILASILRLGFLVSFLGHPVTSGFTSGAAIIIGLSQLKYILGYDIKKSQYIYETIAYVLQDITKTELMPLILGVVTLTFLIVNKKLSQKYKAIAIMGPLGPLICCLCGTLLLWAWPMLHEELKVKYVGKIPHGSLETSFEGWRLSDVGKVLPTALSACLIGYMESIAIGKNLAAKHGYDIDAGQEMLSLGISNLVGACFSCYPVTGSFSRSAVNNSTGALSQLSGLITATVMFATLMFLTPLFYYLPKYVLAAIVMNSVIPLVAINEARKLWRVKREDCALWIVAFFGTLILGVLMGIVVAVSLSLVIVIYESVRPQIAVLWRIPGTTIYRNMKQESSGVFIPNVFICRIGSSMYFANASFVKDMLLSYVADLEEVNKTEYIILEMTPVVSIDSTAVHAIQDVVSDFRKRGIMTAFAMVGNRVEKTMRHANLKEFIGEQWFFPTVNEAVQYCLRHQHALRQRALSNLDEEPLKLSSNLPLENIAVSHGNEVGFSNDLHSKCTTVFLSFAEDVPMITAEIAAAFKRSRASIVQAQIEPFNDTGAKHTYLLKSVRTDGKLSDAEVERLREELTMIWSQARPVGPAIQGDVEAPPLGLALARPGGASSCGAAAAAAEPAGGAGGGDAGRIRELEQALALRERQLAEQTARLEAVLRGEAAKEETKVDGNPTSSTVKI